MAQHLRRSQFITTYGPGAILEGQDGPKVIPSLDQSGIFNQSRRITDFEITDQRLSQALLQGAGVVRLPSNAEVGETDQRWIYNTKRFPSWSLCLRHGRTGILYQKRPGNNMACPCQFTGYNAPCVFTQSAPDVFTNTAPFVFTKSAPVVFGKNAPPSESHRLSFR